MADEPSPTERWRHWPYPTKSMIEAPDQARLEQHAEAMLSRALNIGRVVAFVGAGASMSYGRISWAGLVYRAQEAALALAEDPKYKAQIDDKNDAAWERARRALQALNGLKIQQFEEPHNEDLPVIVGFSELLDREIRAAAEASGIPVLEKAHKKFRTTIQELTRNDQGQAENILEDAFTYGSDAKNRAALQEQAKEACWGTKDDPADKSLRSGFRRLFRTRILAALARTASGSDYGKHIRNLAMIARKHYPDEAAGWLPPIHRFLIGAFIVAVAPNKRARVLSAAVQKDESHDPLRVQRHEIVPRNRDPILMLIQDLGINRFLTTNYDAEIERALRDLGYQVTGAPDWLDPDSDRKAEPVAPMAQAACAIVFTSAEAGRLISTAVEDREQDATVVHLHGRAEDGGEIIVTESDYKKRYLRVNEYRPLVDESIALAFGANPILFVGSGMTEDDILRPLRQFASSRGPLDDRLGIALLPGTKSEKDLLKRKITLLERYGVYAINFGNVSFDDASGQDKEVLWLSIFWTLRDKIAKILSALANSPTDKSKKSKDLKKKIWIDALNSIKELNDFINEESKNHNQLWKGEKLAIPSRIEGLAHRKSSGTDRDAPSLELEIEITNAAIDFLNSLPSLSSPLLDSVAAPQLRRTARAYQVAMAGVADSVQSVFQCARLARTRREWQSWREEWMKLPKPLSMTPPVYRHPAAFKYGAAPPNGMPILHTMSRQSLDLPLIPDELAYGPASPARGRFYRDSPSQIFNALRAALIANLWAVNAVMGRRVLLLVSHRGAGKGHFLVSIEPPAGGNKKSRLHDLLACLGGIAGVRWLGAAFLNLGLSHEVVSVFDRIVLFLEDQAKHFSPRLHDDIERYKADLKCNRIERLKFVLKQYGTLPAGKLAQERRLLIVVSGIGMLFESNGLPKNAEIRRLFEAIFGAEARRAPVDFIFVTTAPAVPPWFRTLPAASASNQAIAAQPAKIRVPRGYEPNPQISSFLTLAEPDLTPAQTLRLAERMDAAQLSWLQTVPITQRPRPEHGVIRQPLTMVHHFREARCSVLLTAFFPDLAIMLALLELNRRDTSGQACPEQACVLLSPDWLLEAQAQIRKKMGPVTGRRLDGGFVEMNRADLTYPALLVTAAHYFKEGRDGLVEALELFDLGCTTQRQSTGHNTPEERVSYAFYRHMSDSERLRCVQARERLERRFGSLFEAVGHGRFALTLVASTAVEVAAAADPEGKLSSFGMQQADQFLRDLVDGLTALDHGQRDDNAISRCLTEIERLHARAATTGQSPFPRDRHGKMFHDLLETIIWHLAVIGQPVEIPVLARCPNIRRACFTLMLEEQSKLGLKGVSDPRTREKLIYDWVRRGVGELCRTCLAFEVEPLPLRGSQPGPASPNSTPTGAKSDGHEFRYAVHSLVQRHIFHQLGAPLVEFPQADQFTVTIYATQPNDLPRLSQRAHEDLSRTAAALAGYDNDRGDAETYYLRTDADDKYIQKRMLRAALALLQSIYSLPVIARFQVTPETNAGSDDQPSQSALGFLEEHRRLIRWLLRQAVKLEPADDNAAEASSAYALHEEEIVWLFNEAGVLSLVQGRLQDARALFDRALEAARTMIEPSEDGALRTRIQLNRAIVDIERGKIGRAFSILHRIADAPDREHPIPPLLARGYIGLGHHLGGDVNAARKCYDDVIEPLREMRRYRSASIFARHKADLLRVSDPDLSEARNWAEQSIRYAMDGGHEDLRHLGLLAVARIDIAGITAEHDQSISASEVQAKLVVVERYARAIGIPRMLCDVAHFRALLHQHGGNLTSAGSLASDALEIAARNGMKVKKIGLLVLLARINVARGHPAIAVPLLDHAARIARSAKCHFELANAQNLINELSLYRNRVRMTP